MRERCLQARMSVPKERLVQRIAIYEGKAIAILLQQSFPLHFIDATIVQHKSRVECLCLLSRYIRIQKIGSYCI